VCTIYQAVENLYSQRLFVFQECDMGSTLFFVLAAICFGAGAFGVKVIVFGNEIQWISAGLCCLTIALWLV
jgi:hypothetical protein